MNVYMEWYHWIFILLGILWGIWVGWMLRGDENKDRILTIQLAHTKELFRTRKARLCDLLGIEHGSTTQEN